MREPPADFVARLKLQCGSDWDVRFNEHVGRWEFQSNSASGMRVSQFWGWYYNPLTGAKIEPDGVTGLIPFRDLDLAAQAEILDNLEKSYIGNRVDGARDWETYSGDRMKYNQQISAANRKARGDDWAYMLKQIPTNRPWLSDTYFDKRKQRKGTA